MGVLDVPGISRRDPKINAAPRVLPSALIRNMVGALPMAIPPTISQSASSTGGWTNNAPVQPWMRYVGAPTFSYTGTASAEVWGKFASSKYITGDFTNGNPNVHNCVEAHPLGGVGPTNSFNIQGSALIVGTGIPTATTMSGFSNVTGILTMSANFTGTTGTYTFEVKEKWPGVLRACFEFDGQAFEFQTKTLTAAVSMRVWVNEQPHALTATAINNFSGNGFVKVDFGTASRGQPRRIVVELIGSGGTDFPCFIAWRAAATDAFARSPVRTSTLAIVGDSIACATGATEVSQGYDTQLGRLLGMDAITFAMSGTGIYSGWPTYVDRSAEIIAAAPDVILIQGTLNDGSFYSLGITTDITANLTAFLSALKAGLPTATIIMCGPLLPAQVVGNDLAVEGLYQTACTAANVTYLPTATIGDYPVTGTGWSANVGINQTAISGTGNTTNGSPTVSSVSSTRFANGQLVTGTGIPAGTTVSSGGGTATLTLSANATATNTGITITGGARTMADGGADYYRGADSVHPEPRGHDRLARWLAARISPYLAIAPSGSAAPRAGYGVFGDASDGTATLDGTATVAWASKSGNTYTMTRDCCCTDLTVASGVTLLPHAYRIFCTGTLTNAGTISDDGGAGNANGTAGAATSNGYYPTSGAGGAGNTGAGSAGANTTAFATGNGGAAGAGSSGAAGAGGTISGAGKTFVYKTPAGTLSGVINFQGGVRAIGGGAGGGGGSGDATNKGGGGGGGGGMIAIFAAAAVSSGAISAVGGAGGTPATGNCGGGGGGAGGIVVIYTLAPWANTGTTAITGGAAGAGVGSGAAGSAGTSGNVMNVVLA